MCVCVDACVCQKRRVRLTGALVIIFTPRHHTITGLQQVVFIRSLLCLGVHCSDILMCVKPIWRVGGQRGLIGQEPLTQITSLKHLDVINKKVNRLLQKMIDKGTSILIKPVIKLIQMLIS